MWSFGIQPGFANTIVDFTNDLSLLTVGLIGLMGVSAAMLAVVAVRHYLAEKARPAVETAPSFTDYRKAA